VEISNDQKRNYNKKSESVGHFSSHWPQTVLDSAVLFAVFCITHLHKASHHRQCANFTLDRGSSTSRFVINGTLCGHAHLTHRERTSKKLRTMRFKRTMKVTSETTIQSIVEAHPKAVTIFSDHGIGKRVLSDRSMLGSVMEMCKSMGPNNDLDDFLSDLQVYINKKAS